MFVLYTIEIIMQEWRFWATIFDFEHRAVSRKRPEVCSLGVLLVGGNGMNKSPQIASKNALNKEYNMRQDNIDKVSSFCLQNVDI